MQFEVQEFLVEPQVERLRNTILSDRILRQNRIEKPRAIDQSVAEFRQPISTQQNLQQNIGDVAAARDERSFCRVHAFQPRDATTWARASSPFTKFALLPQNCYKRAQTTQSSIHFGATDFGDLQDNRLRRNASGKSLLKRHFEDEDFRNSHRFGTAGEVMPNIKQTERKERLNATSVDDTSSNATGAFVT